MRVLRNQLWLQRFHLFPLYTHAVVPLVFRHQVSVLTLEHSFESNPLHGR